MPMLNEQQKLDVFSKAHKAMMQKAAHLHAHPGYPETYSDVFDRLADEAKDDEMLRRCTALRVHSVFASPKGGGKGGAVWGKGGGKGAKGGKGGKGGKGRALQFMQQIAPPAQMQQQQQQPPQPPNQPQNKVGLLDAQGRWCRDYAMHGFCAAGQGCVNAQSHRCVVPGCNARHGTLQHP
jgi:hypothetical protein